MAGPAVRRGGWRRTQGGAVQNLFASAAVSLLGDSRESCGADVRLLLQALDYIPTQQLHQIDRGLMHHRALLLRAASRFARVFQLAAPDAPGLISFGAEFDPAIAD